ncbi:plasmid replication protein, CyRepA1 family [Pannus brasiliensis]
MDYLGEWRESKVDDRLIGLNVIPLRGSSPTEYLLYSDELPRRNDGRVKGDILKRYEHTTLGGWWCSGIDLLTGDNDLWGCFKPNFPRSSAERGKPIKYEHPPKAPTGVFALRVPRVLWEKIAERLKTPIVPRPIETDQTTETPGDDGFWQWVIDNPSIPVCITEGAKKAGALLTAGYVAIALPGIHNGYRTPKDESGQRIGKSRLIPQLQKLAVPGREIYFVFDRETRPKTLQAVNLAIQKTGPLFARSGCTVKVVTWNPRDGKGVDDFIANKGTGEFEIAYQQAVSLEVWKARELTRLTHAPAIEIYLRYLGALEIPETARLIGIKSPKGTGKSEFLAKVVRRAIENGQEVLVIGHRVKLVEELCQRFGLKYITEVIGDASEEVIGYGLCIDSLHERSRAKFNPDRWSNALVIIDEVEQVLWHALNGDTCKTNRVAILKSLKTLVQNAIEGEGKIYISDADLSDISLNYLISLSGIDLNPYIIVNNWKPTYQEAWRVYSYSENTPKELVNDLVKHIQEGGKPFVCLSAQKLKSQWGTRTLESYLKRQFPLARILRLDSESLNEVGHPAYQCIGNLNSLLRNYDIVLASPAIETGVSIDIKGHFSSVWCIAQGVQTPTSICQFLGRIRDNVPRYLWAAGYGFNQIGNGSTSIPDLLTSGHRLTEVNIRLLQQSDLESLDDLDTGFQAESLLCWARMAVRVNASMLNYRDSILGILLEEGHRIKDRKDSGEDENSDRLTEAIEEIREENYRGECEAIATARDITDEEYRYLKKQIIKSVTEKRILRKYDLQKRYGIEVTPRLVVKDDEGWYQELRLHYFLTIGRQFLCDRDALIARKLIESGHGSLFIPDFNGSQLGIIIGTMEVLGIPVLLAHPDRELRNTDTDLRKMAEIAIANRSEIKTIARIGIAANSSPITIVRRFLDLLGYGLQGDRSERINKKTVKVYRIIPPIDDRDRVFQQWLFRDERQAGSSEVWYEDYLLAVNPKPNPETENDSYIQLSLEFGN